MMMLDADSLVGLVVEDHENRVFEIIGFYMVLDSPNPITYIKLKDLDKKTLPLIILPPPFSLRVNSQIARVYTLSDVVPNSHFSV